MRKALQAFWFAFKEVMWPDYCRWCGEMVRTAPDGRLYTYKLNFYCPDNIGEKSASMDHPHEID